MLSSTLSQFRLARQAIRPSSGLLLNTRNIWIGDGSAGRSTGKISNGIKNVNHDHTQTDTNLKRAKAASPGNINVEGARFRLLGYNNPPGRSLQSQKTMSTTTRNITTSVEDFNVKDNAVDMGQAASIDAAAEIPGGRDPIRWHKYVKLTQEALDKIPGEKRFISVTRTQMIKEKEVIKQAK